MVLSNNKPIAKTGARPPNNKNVSGSMCNATKNSRASTKLDIS